MMAVRSFFVLFLATRGASHNIYTENSSTLTGNSSSQFGYSVAFWETNNKMKLVVAAPMEDNGLGGDGEHGYGLIIPGEVYLFDPHNEFTICCQGDTKLEPLYDPGSDKKDLRTYGKGGYYFGLGSTVVTGSSANAPLLMCAPRSSYYKQRGGDRTVIPEGECLLLYGNSHKPLRLKPKTNNVRYCGFSAAFDKVFQL
ncbi:hypothetical protein Hamer_G015004 [Homarus americanus]|uniref:Uncharacterized protein n=1 Tax=Homarus americanus TaxID=6706 RepID=A0A8J5MKE1_HOMAM|nr:hypothetical protein Hamer_G015004 [Homarus americanus]